MERSTAKVEKQPQADNLTRGGARRLTVVDRYIAKYLQLIERVAKVEYRRVPNHMIDYEELVSIGTIAVQNIFEGKTAQDIEKLNISYIATATRWAIRNELRARYKWYTMKHSKVVEEKKTEENKAAAKDDDDKESPEKVREAVYETILSIDSIVDGQDGDSSYDCISDGNATPEEHLEVVELGRAIRRAIENLPPKERTT
ncbi:MAG: hypothetical protein R2857_15895 [Vampirovibrionales bacterium]